GAVSDYAQNTSLEEFGADLKEVATNVETYENLAGSLVAAGAVSKVSKLGSISKTSNPVPERLARVRNAKYSESATLGAPGAEDVFVTAASDLRGITTAEGLAKRLTLLDNDGNLLKGPFQVIEFDTPGTGLSSPVFRSNPGFIGGGKTLGGAREFTLPNLDLSQLKGINFDIKF
ncbi:polymorphic toxin type 10 domain-containing protein, partial [Ascidiimonas aurantiaca]|uniref:polymorphic toxin type 10 domain-containing protein n=1 Tax=Ascidiimonas aurantiaca TaxID=1685432 RepID=UPI0030EBCCE2